MNDKQFLHSTRAGLRVAIVGAGALGTEVMLRMAEDSALQARLHGAWVIDPDCVEAKNQVLSRLYSQAAQGDGATSLGQSKAKISAGFLNARSSHLWVALPCEFADVSWSILRRADLLLCCTDNALSRVEVALAARALSLPVLDAGVLGEGAPAGRVTWFSPEPEAACYLCGLGENRRAELLAYASAVSLSCDIPPATEMGSEPPIRESLQQTAAAVLEQLRHVAGVAGVAAPPATGPESFAIHLREGPGSWTREKVHLRVSGSCPWHDRNRAPLLAVAIDQTFLCALRAAGSGADLRIQLPWPICVLAACRRCGWRDDRPRRVALIRRHGTCENCGHADQLEPLCTVDSIGENDSMAETTPRQLGFHEQQLLQLRPGLRPRAMAGGEA